MSDSEWEEDDYEVGTTSVSLGFADDKTDEFLDVYSNHVGGQPVWLHSDSPPDDELTKCDNCQQQLRLLTQIYSNVVENVYYDRVLYVFACVESKCRRKEGSIKAIRGIKRDEKKEQEIKQKKDDEERQIESKKREKQENILKLGETIFKGGNGGDSNPFASGSGSNPFASASPFEAKKEEEPKVEKKKEKEEEESDDDIEPKTTGPEFQSKKYPQFNQSYYIYVEPEVLEEQEQIDTSKVEILKEDEELPGEGASSSNNSNTNDKENESIMKAVEQVAKDLAFQHFNTILQNNPEQVVRYEPQTLEPLLYNDTDAVAKTLTEKKLPDNKKLELQIMPYLIMLLEPEVDNLADGMEWGTIFMATSCNDSEMPKFDKNGVGYLQEWCGVQWEEDVTQPK